MRVFTALFSPLPLCVAVALSSPGAAEAQSASLRVIAANLSSGNAQAYDLPSVSSGGEGARILSGLHGDVVLLQEFNYGGNTAGEIRTFVDTTFGPQFSYYRESGAQIPNAVISRYPIISAGDWTDPEVSNRAFAWARIDIPGPLDLWVISVHLLTDTSKHTAEAAALLSDINANVPGNDLLVIGGDFNAASRSDAALTGLSADVHTSGPYPVDQNGVDATNSSRAKPYDGIYTDTALSAFSTQTTIGTLAFPNGAVIDTRVFTASQLTAISPALASDSAGTNMQHMAIVRDFTVPVPEPGTATLFGLATLIFISRRRRVTAARD